MNAKLLLCLALTVPVALFAAGCGSDDGEAGTETPSVAETGSSDGATGDQGTEGATGADSDAGTGSEAATGDGTGAGDAPSREDYIAQADEICRKAEEEFTKAVEQGFEGQSPNQEEVGAALETAFTENLEGQLGDLRALTPPAGDEQALAAMYDSLELAIQDIADDPSSLASPSRAMRDASRRARAYGLEQCGS